MSSSGGPGGNFWPVRGFVNSPCLKKTDFSNQLFIVVPILSIMFFFINHEKILEKGITSKKRKPVATKVYGFISEKLLLISECALTFEI